MHHFAKIRTFSALGLTALLTACASTPYHTPSVPTPGRFAHAEDATGQGANTASDLTDWWTAFNDPALNSLVSNVLAKNNDLAAAALRVQQAQLQAGLTRLDQLPSANGNVGVSTGDSTRWSASLGVSYEADLWGRLAAATRAANWEVQATAEDREAARLALIGTTAELYWRIAYTHQQITVGEQNLAYARKVLDLVTIQHKAGAVSGVEVSESEQSVNSQIASLADLQQQLVEYRSSLTVLLGGDPWPQTSEPQVLPDTPLPDVRAGLPAELLGRRPDLRAAEWRLRETLADVDIARTSLYPGLNLTASGGASSSELGALFRNPTGSLAASLSLPFLDFPRLNRNVKISEKTYDIAVLTFKTTLLQAFADTDNALSARTQLARQAEAQAASLAAARKAESLYAVRYRTGSVALRIWLDAQQSLRQEQLSYDNNRLSQLINQSTLYQALGGGVPPQ
jgi:NodT family efflux transporter outer membrane factor (OMF) lipoprotein